MLFEPAAEPFTLQAYTGESPGFTGLAVNVTEVPLQTVPAEAEIEILALINGFTVTKYDTVVPMQPALFGVIV